MFSYFKSNRRARQIALFSALQFLAVAAVVFAFLYRAYLDTLPGQGRLSACPMHDWVHLYCPGCGGTRAMVALFRGQIVHSLLCNPLSAYIVAGFAVFDVRAAVALVRREERVFHFSIPYFWVMLAIAVLNFVLRNVLLVSIGLDYLGDLAAYWH
ncbi:MAG: DUF2752 domain-containing protein [Clostridia bacterium]|nr:DUF2752 domain-containing protein [Clostridia bacterium]